MRQWLLSVVLISALLASTDLAQRAAPAPAAYLQVAGRRLTLRGPATPSPTWAC